MCTRAAVPSSRNKELSQGAEVFTKIDLKSAYNQVRVEPGHEYLTSFRCRLEQYLVMPFGLSNAPACFMRFMNTVFQDMLDTFMTCYLDDVVMRYVSSALLQTCTIPAQCLASTPPTFVPSGQAARGLVPRMSADQVLPAATTGVFLSTVSTCHLLRALPSLPTTTRRLSS